MYARDAVYVYTNDEEYYTSDEETSSALDTANVGLNSLTRAFSTFSPEHHAERQYDGVLACVARFHPTRGP